MKKYTLIITASVLGVFIFTKLPWRNHSESPQFVEEGELLEISKENVHTIKPTLLSNLAATPEPTLAATPAFKRQYEIGEVFSDALKSGGNGPELVVIPSGSFQMGSPKNEWGRGEYEGPQRKVNIKAFALGQTEITFNDYAKYATANGLSLLSDNTGGRGLRPQVYVSWKDANAYAKWLKEQTGFNYRLPSEAEWEYAAKAGTTTPFNTGECINGEQANFGGELNGRYSGCPEHTEPLKQTAPVKSYPANAFGLYDMHGNVWEWVQDCYSDYYEGAPSDGSALRSKREGKKCAFHVLRGGSWMDTPDNLRSAYRGWTEPHVRDEFLGFRLARTL